MIRLSISWRSLSQESQNTSTRSLVIDQGFLLIFYSDYYPIRPACPLTVTQLINSIMTIKNKVVLILCTVAVMLSGQLYFKEPPSHYYSSNESLQYYSASALVSKNTTNNLKNKAPLCPTKCSKILGQNGTWIQDWNYSATHGQYPSRAIPQKPHDRKTHDKFQPSDDAPFPWPTSFRWVDSNSLDHEGSSCQIDYTMTAATFCDALLKLDIGMVIFSGDSLTWSMRRSLFNKMGNENVQNVTNRAWNNEAGFSGHLICKDSSSSSDKVKSIPVFQQVAHGGEWGKGPQNNSFDNVTRDLIQSTPDRVLAIYNFGAHYHSMDSYKNDFDQLLEWLEHQYHRPHDLVFFRTTVPGHTDCQPRKPQKFDYQHGTREHPLASIADYQSSSNTAHDWNLFQEYNDYSLKRAQEHSKKGIVPIHILDVYNMTLLRRDGHSGGADCLHYVEPGPVDWWNHLLFTYLKDLSAAKECGN
jgi:hypothetical protein